MFLIQVVAYSNMYDTDHYHMSQVRKPAIVLSKNTGADQMHVNAQRIDSCFSS